MTYNAEGITRNLATIETEANKVNGQPLNQADTAARLLQVHATLALGGALVLIAEEIANLRVSLGENDG